MADTSLYATILDACAAAVAGLGLSSAGRTVPVAVYKAPRALEKLDAAGLPVFTVSPEDEGESVEPLSTEDLVLVKYRVEIALVAAANRDFSGASLDLWFTWRQQVRRLFQFGLPGVALSSVFFVEEAPGKPVERAQQAKNYAVSRLNFAFWSAEQRAN